MPDLKSIIHSDPDIHSGDPVFVGTRVPMRTFLDYIEGGDSLDVFLENFPSVSREQAVAFLEEAGRAALARIALMKSHAQGDNTSRAEVTNISAHGFWIWIAGRELFLPFSEFPWFVNASVGQLTHVEWPSEDHLHWPDLDVDLCIRSIEHPEEFPLKYRGA